MKEPEVREYVLRLHSAGMPWGKRADEVDWDETAVGDPVPFQAVHFGEGSWSALGPVAIAAAEALPDAAWTVSTGAGEAPLIVGYVGRPLAKGEEFHRPVGMVTIGVPRD
jgi:hypothetical protein